jgi:hypothetical protein
MIEDREHQSDVETNDAGISRRRFAALSGAALLTSLLGTPGSLAALGSAPGGRRSARTATGTFDLRITVVGLCFFVPDPLTKRMHVLMPSTAGHAHGGVSRHVTRLLYDAAHQQAGAEGLAGEAVSVPLDDGALDFARLPGGLDLALPGSVVDVSPIVRDGVSRDALSNDSGGRVRARVSFAAGRMSAPHRELRWDLGPYRAHPMANAVEWTVPGVSGDGIELPVSGLHGKAGPPLRPLHPVNGTLDLIVLHVLPEEVLPFGRPRELPEPGFAAADFAAYYSLFDNPAETPLPRFSGDGEGMRAVQVAYGGASATERTSFGGAPSTCLVGGGKPKGGGG